MERDKHRVDENTESLRPVREYWRGEFQRRVGMEVVEEDPLEILNCSPFNHRGLNNMYYDLECGFQCGMVVDPVILDCGHFFCSNCATVNIGKVDFIFHFLFIFF